MEKFARTLSVHLLELYGKVRRIAKSDGIGDRAY